MFDGRYNELMGVLLFFENNVRPDTYFTVAKLYCSRASPKQGDGETTKRLICNFKGISK